MAVYPALAPIARTASSVTVTRSPITAQHRATLFAKVDAGTASNGLVQFAIDGNPVSNVTAVGPAGRAKTATILPRGKHAITATYLGSATEYPSRSDPLAYTLTALTSSTTVSTPTTTVSQIHPVDVNVAVAGANGLTPTGRVKTTINGHSPMYTDLDGYGHATVWRFLPVGTPHVTVTYEGNEIFAPSYAGLDFTVTPPYTSSLDVVQHVGSELPNGRRYVSLAVIVTGLPGAPRPTGTVTAGAGFVCQPLVPMINVHKAKTRCGRTLPPGTRTLYVDYFGDALYEPRAKFVLVQIFG
jgi:hypothetical protein